MQKMDKAALKARVCEIIRERNAEIVELGHAIFGEPELGFKEVKTAEKVKQAFEKLGIAYETGWGITGVKARMKGKASKRTVALLGELDAIVCRTHPNCDPVTGAAHCCGHNVQIANVIAVAQALKEAGAMDYLGGDVVLFAVPAEEYVEIDYRSKLRDEGKLRFLGGKQQIIAEGGFDDCDIAMQMHVAVTDNPEGDMMYAGSCNGFIGKLIEYHGRAAHAAGAPSEGINALNAAMMGIMGVNAIRETFREEDCVRFHPIINAGGDLVNVIPDFVKMESYCRASTVKALSKYNNAINRALKAGGDVIGARCEIKDLPGYLPLAPDAKLAEVLRENAAATMGEKNIFSGMHSAGSTDMGDVSQIMPTVHPWVGCVKGTLHGADYVVDNEEVAYVKCPQALAGMIIDLLWDNAEKADEICREFKPVFTKETYCQFLEDLSAGKN